MMSTFSESQICLYMYMCRFMRWFLSDWGGGGQDVSKDFINESMNSMMGRVG